MKGVTSKVAGLFLYLILRLLLSDQTVFKVLQT